jgi:glyoxylase-like metal-dependent hydrolase (beta-lactamase superfamily II)
MKTAWTKALVTGLLAMAAAAGGAVEIRFERVADGVYAHVGDVGPRTVANEGLNANIGLVLTRGAALLIDSGATHATAQQIEAAVRAITPHPVRWVVNTGGQDHRWLGNGYFASRGAQLIAHAKAADDMRSRGGDQLAALRALLGPKADGTVPVLPTRLVEAADARLDLDGLAVEFRHRGGGHTPGDMMVWLPQSRVLFAGDIVYVDRLPAVLPVSNTRSWLEAFDVAEQLAPQAIVPGHGRIGGLTPARQHTRDYLRSLRAHMKGALDANIDISDAIKRFNVQPFAHLVNAAELHPGNASRVYLEMERE